MVALKHRLDGRCSPEGEKGRAWRLRWGQDDLARYPPGLFRREGPGAVPEGDLLSDDRPEATGLYPPAQLLELPAIRLHDEEDRSVRIALRVGAGGRLHGRDDDPAGTDHRGASLHELTTDEVEDHVNVSEALLHLRAVHVDEHVGAKLQHEVARPGSGHPDHPDARCPGELDGERADPATGGVDDDSLARHQAAVDEEGLPGRQAGKRDGA